MGRRNLNDHLLIITKNADGSKASQAVYICSHGGNAAGKSFSTKSDIIFYCPDKHELNADARVFFSSGSRFGMKLFTYSAHAPVPDYYLTKAVGKSNTTGFSYTELEQWRTSDALRSDVVSIRNPAFHSSTVKLSWVIQELQLNGYDYMQFHVFSCRSLSKKAPGWNVHRGTCTDPNCQLSHDT